MKTCATCKHWQPEEWIRKSIDDSDITNADFHTGHCEILEDTLEIEECNSYGSGYNGIESIETPWNFGCNNWEAK